MPNKILETNEVKQGSESKLASDNHMVDTDNTDTVKKEDKPVTITDNTSTSVKTIDTPKAVVNTAKAGEAFAAGSGSSNAASSVARSNGGLLFSGGAGQVGDDLGATSRSENPYRAGTRMGKRVDPITRRVDYLNSEILKTSVKESKPLSETDAKQGYNGNYFNEHAITQKTNGGAPADHLFNRSADLLSFDMLYYPEGQFNTKLKETPTLDIRRERDSDDYLDMPFGNFVHRNLKVNFNKKTGNVEAMSFTVDDITPVGLDEKTFRASGDAYLRLTNRNELDRLAMVAKAGNESDPKWSCLGDAINDATDQNMLYREVDACAGDMVYLSYNKLSTALAYQLNKTAKDGRRQAGPLAEMMNHNVVGTYGSLVESCDEDSGFDNAFGVREVLSNGGAGYWLRLMDTVLKYTTKGKALSLPLSFKNALTMCAATCKPLVMHSMTRTLLESQELFSTIDHPYDPFLPIITTDGASLVLPINYNKMFKIIDGKYVSNLQTLSYENIRNVYQIPMLDHFTAGLFDFFNMYADKTLAMSTAAQTSGTWPTETIKALHTNTSTGAVEEVNVETIVLNIPITSTTLGISLWDLIVCSSVQFMVDRRIEPFTEVIKYEANFGYPYSGCEHINLDFSPRNYSFGGTDTPINVGICTGPQALRVTFPEVFWVKSRQTGKTSIASTNKYVSSDVVLPFYFNQTQFEETGANKYLVLSDNFASMSYPSTRSGSTLGGIDSIYGMSEEAFRSCFDRMTVYPCYEGTTEYSAAFSKRAYNRDTKTFYEPLTYKYGLTGDGIPVLKYNAYAIEAADAKNVLTIKDILKTPREVGYMQVAPAGYLTPTTGADKLANFRDADSSYIGTSGPGFKMTVWHADGSVSSQILTEGSTNITIGADLSQVWHTYCANPYDTFDQGWLIASGGLFTAASSAGQYSLEKNKAVFNAFVKNSYVPLEYDPLKAKYTNSEAQDSTLEVVSLQKYLWGRLQRLPFVVNPFDAATTGIVGYTSDALENINSYDIYDAMYIFGYCGNRSSDYTELVDQRQKARIGQGMNYIEDPFVIDSVLLK